MKQASIIKLKSYNNKPGKDGITGRPIKIKPGKEGITGRPIYPRYKQRWKSRK